MSLRIPGLNGTCPCRSCQKHMNLTSAQRERRKRMKLIDHYVEQMARQK